MMNERGSDDGAYDRGDDAKPGGCRHDAGYSKTQNVMSLANSDGVPGRLYVTNQFTVSRGGDIVDYVAGNSGDGSMLAAEYKAVETGKTTQERVKAGQRVLPWSVSIAYGLNGPQVKPSQIAGAS